MSASHEDETRGDVPADERDSREIDDEVNRILHEEILKGAGTGGAGFRCSPTCQRLPSIRRPKA